MVVKRPLVWALMFLVAGVLAARLSGGHMAAAFALALGTAAFSALAWRKTRLAAVVLLPIMAAAGFACYIGATAEKPIAAVYGTVVTLSGRLTSVNISGSGRVWGVLQTETFGKVYVCLPEGMEAQAGQNAAVTGEVLRLSPARNPGAYDESLYLGARGIGGKMFADEAALGDVPPSITAALGMLRADVSDAFFACLPQREAGVLNAMITGDRTGIDEDVDTLYRDAGIYHIIAVSGTHMTILAAAVNAVLRKLRLSHRLSGGLSFGVVLAYCLFTGACPAAVRAVIMFGVITPAPFIRRDADAASAACFAAILILLYSPLYLLDVGFLYSFAAVLALTAGTSAVERGMARLMENGRAPLLVARLFNKAALRQAVAATLAVFLVTWPLTAYCFYHVSFISMVANLLILPTVTLLTVAGFLVGVAGLFSTTLGVFLGGAAQVILRFYEGVCRVLTAMPFAQVLTGRPPLWLLALYLAALLLLLSALHKRGAAFGKRLRITGVAGAACVLALAVWLAVPKPLVVAVLDVGQGDATVLSKNNQAVIWDGGGQVLKPLGDNTGEWVVLPYLRYLGIERADAVLTHADADHALGILEAMDAGVVKRLIVPTSLAADDGLATLILETAAANDVPVYALGAGDMPQLLSGVSFSILHPQAASGTGNNGSLVCRVAYGEASFLLTGDVELAGETQMLADYGAYVDVDVLKLAHHGSRSSSAEAFLLAASPGVAVASAGQNNRYGHPAAEVVTRLDGLGIPLVVTAERGAVLFSTYGKGIEMRTMLQAQ